MVPLEEADAGSGKGLAAYFPSLSDDGPREVVEAAD